MGKLVFRAAEEKQQAESEQKAQKTTNRRVPKISVATKSDGDSQLAPWQLELQRK